MGNEKLFKNCLGKASNGNLDIPDDEYAKRKSESILQNGISRDEIELIKLKNLLDDGEYNSAYAALMQKVLSFEDPTVKAQGLAYLSEAAVNLNKNYEGIKYAEEADSLNSGGEKWIKPYSKYLIAKAFYNSGNLKMSKMYLKDAADNNDYEYKVLLSSYINNLKRKF